MRVLLAVLLVGIVGCGGEDNSPEDVAVPSSPTVTPVKAENAETGAPKTKPLNSEDVSEAEPKDLTQERTETPTDVPSDSSSDEAVAALVKSENAEAREPKAKSEELPVQAAGAQAKSFRIKGVKAPARKAKTVEADAKDAVVVVAEGVGLNPDLALKNAFRQAVRQVVGAYVDAETLVKNDKLVHDKVLTYSRGFVIAYKQISERKRDGLFWVTITATVQRQRLVDELEPKAALRTVLTCENRW